MSDSQRTQGVHHVGLTVADIHACRDFFVTALGYSQVGEKPAYPALFVSDGHTMLTLWQASDDARGFDRVNAIGLHHLALKVENKDGLLALHQNIADRADCEVEFAPEPLGTSGMHHMMTRIPGGVRIEFIAMAE